MPKKIILFFFLTLMLISNEVKIIKNVGFIQGKFNNKQYKIERTQEKGASLTNSFALTSRPSPPFYIQPFQVSPKVKTYGEIEVLKFISKKKGVFIDARLENWYKKSKIPTSVNIPFKIFLSKSTKRIDILTSFGGIYNQEEKEWDFSQVKTLLFYCNGAWCGQSPTAINALIELGYPQKKMKYYRGGMQSWQLLGLTTIIPEENK